MQLRSHGHAHAGVVTPTDEGVRVHLREPAEAVAAGQAAVFYAGTRVLGSATIATTRRVASRT